MSTCVTLAVCRHFYQMSFYVIDALAICFNVNELITVDISSLFSYIEKKKLYYTNQNLSKKYKVFG